MTHLARPKTSLSDYISPREDRIWTWVTNSLLFGAQIGGAFWAAQTVDPGPWPVNPGAVLLGCLAGFVAAMTVLVVAIYVRKRQLQRRMGERRL